MMPAPEKVLSHVISVLQDQVLPELEPATWTAANIRASVTLLTHLQDLMTTAADSPLQERAAILAFLGTLTNAKDAWIEPALRADIAAAPNAANGETVHAQNDRLKQLLSTIVKSSENKRTPEFEKTLRECLAIVNSTEFAPLARAAKMPPF